jgi:hypothetical protein
VSTSDFLLGPTPDSPRARELWLQHAAGFILFEDARGYAVAALPADLEPSARAVALKAIDDALYGLMMVIDGVTGGLCDPERLVRFDARVTLAEHGQDTATVRLADGDGMCMGFHGWREGDFGEAPVAIRRA